jgi:hypothetical protein
LTKTTLAAAIALLLNALVPAAGATWTTAGGELIATTPAYTLRLDATTGAPHALLLRGRAALTFGDEGWWRLTRADGKIVRATDARVALKRTNDDLQLDYAAPQGDVALTVHCGETEIELRATVRAGQGEVVRAAIPPQLDFDPERLTQVSFPFELGRALLPPFFRRQQGPRLAGWTPHPIGGGGAAAAGLAAARNRDYNEPPVKVEVTPAGQEWLGAEARTLESWSVRCPRAPADEPEITLLDTSSGPLLSLQAVDGGWGRVIRWGGVFSQDDQSRVISASVQTALALWNRPITNGARVAPPADRLGKPRREAMPRRIGFIDLGDAPQGAAWQAALAQLNTPIVTIGNPEELQQHLTARDCWLIVNPYPELLPAAATDAHNMAAAIRAYVTNGGVWLHTGGYPFYVAIEPQRYLQVSQTYPPAFSDFVHLALDSGQVSVYGVQARNEVFMPVNLSAGGSDRGGAINREWITFVASGQSRTLPPTRLHFGDTASEAIRRYGQANGFTRPLADKMRSVTLALLKRSLLVRYGGANCREMAESLPLLPKPAIVHIAEYLHGGFDKQYPDHLPPNPAFGDSAQLSAFVRAIHDSGRLFMPYTNPTWWCDGPPGPTFARIGDAPLVKDRAGKSVREVYGPNYGWSLCAFHPAALAAEQTILRQFTEEYPSDILFQDQVGARSPQYDFNPASPMPDAYIQGMMDIARRDSRAVPLSTENGFDAIMNDETQFCGITWGLVPTESGPEWRELWQRKYPADAWRFTPLALWLAHDKVLFDHHDLGQFVTNRETLAWTLALGYQLSIRTDAHALQDQEHRRWIDWLADLQKTFGPSLMGAPLLSWEESAPGVYRARYGEISLIANTTPRPYPLDAQNTLAPFGFSLRSLQSDAQAGFYDRWQGQDYPTGGYAFVRVGARLTRYPGAPITP